MKLLAFILGTCVWLGLLSPVLAQTGNSYFTRTWLAEDGLPDNRVVGLAQTSDGYLWVATQGGLVRFDGLHFQRVTFPRFPGRLAGTMRALMLDRRDRVWLAKEEEGTLFCFDWPQMHMLTAGQGLPKDERPCSVAMDGESSLWVSYNTGKVIRYSHEGKVDTFTAKDGLPAQGDICWLASGRDGVLWFAKGGHVGVFRNGRFHGLENFGTSAMQIAPARSGGIWVCARRQVLKFDEGVETVKLGEIIPEQEAGHSSTEPSVLLEDRQGVVWVGTVSAGLFRCDSNAVVKVNVSNPAILSLTEDREGSLWVGTRGGLNWVHQRLIYLTGPAEGLPFQGVQSVCQDTTGALWLVGENSLLARGQGTNWTIQTLSNGSARMSATCATAGTNGSVWVGTRHGGLYQWTDGQFIDLGLRDKLRHKSPRSLLVTRKGDLWIGVDSSDALYRLRGKDLQAFALPPGRRFLRAMAEDAAGNVWAAASDGLLVRVTGDELVDETATSAGLSIRCLYATAKGDLWIGFASAGVGRLRNGTLTRFSTEQGLPSDYVSQILADNNDGLWFAGNQGIFQVHERDFDAVADGLATRVWPVIYGRTEGLPGLQASFDFCPDALCSSDNRLFFSTLSGLAEVRLDNVRLNYRQPEVFIERVIADERIFADYQAISDAPATNAAPPAGLRSRGDKPELRFPPGVQPVRFEFTALSFIAPDNVQFRYQLEGLDEHWVEAGTRRFASYSYVPPGSYRFKVIACNNDGIWNTVGDTLSVTFEPYFWQTLWFKLVVILGSFAALCGTVVLVLRRRHRLVVERLEHQRALESERTRIARDLHDDLGVGLTEIGLLGDLVGAGSELPQRGRERLQEMTDRARSLAASLDEIVWAINPANDTTQSLAEYFSDFAQRLLGKAGIRCRIEMAEPMPAGDLGAEDRHEVFHAFKEALNNVIRHSNATEVHVKLTAVEGALRLCVADNGKGFVGPEGAGSRDGLVGMHERLRRLGGRCEINGTSGSGTTVTFTIPMQPVAPS